MSWDTSTSHIYHRSKHLTVAESRLAISKAL